MTPELPHDRTPRSNLPTPSRALPAADARWRDRLRAVHRAALVVLLVLALQFVLGIWVNLFVSFPRTNEVERVLTSSTDPILLAHMAVAFTLLALGILVAALAVRSPLPYGLAALGAAGAGTIFWAFESGIEFIVSGFTNGLASFSMALGFAAALSVYGLLAGVTAVLLGRGFLSDRFSGRRVDGGAQATDGAGAPTEG